MNLSKTTLAAALAAASHLAAQQNSTLQLGQGNQVAVSPSPFSKGTFNTLTSAGYDQGTRLLDLHKYDEAIAIFNRIIASKGERADGALYWKAYALNRLGRGEDALATLASLRKDYASSRWLGDAQVLEAEVKQRAGHPVSPADESNEDIRLMAINGLIGADPERAIPLLENLLRGGSSPQLKQRALFVLTQSKAPKAEQILNDYAKGAGNPDLQLLAIRYSGMSRTPEARQRLVVIYTSSADTSVKKAAQEALFSAGGTDQLLELLRTEKDPSLRSAIITSLAFSKSVPNEKLLEIYAADTDSKTRKSVIDGLLSRGQSKPVIDLARRETDASVKKYIVQSLSALHNDKDATEYMLELLK